MMQQVCFEFVDQVLATWNLLYADPDSKNLEKSFFVAHLSEIDLTTFHLSFLISSLESHYYLCTCTENIISNQCQQQRNVLGPIMETGIQNGQNTFFWFPPNATLVTIRSDDKIDHPNHTNSSKTIKLRPEADQDHLAATLHRTQQGNVDLQFGPGHMSTTRHS